MTSRDEIWEKALEQLQDKVEKMEDDKDKKGEPNE